MILVTCTVASFVTQKSAQKISTSEQTDEIIEENTEQILIPISNPETMEEMVNLSTNFLIIYPRQEILLPHEKKVNLTDSSLLETIEKIDTIGKTVANIFRRKNRKRIKREQK